MKNNELVSIAMATYNGEKFLAEQLSSILDQTYKFLEINICDDCSNDDTIQIITKYQKQDNRIKLFKNKKRLGFKKNFEKAIMKCTGSYIALADQDDIWKNNKIEILIDNINSHDLIHSSVSLIDEKSTIIKSRWEKEDNFKYSFTKLIFGNTVTGCTVLFKRRLLKNFYPIPSAEKYHDWWLALLASRNNGIIYIEKVLVLYRQHRHQHTGAKIETIFQKTKRVFSNIIYKKSSTRYKKSQQQYLRLKSILKEKRNILKTDEIKVVYDAIEYNRDYLNHFFHLKTFKIGLKYNKEIYIKNKFLYKNIIRDIIG